MPAINRLTDPFVRTLTWSKAVRPLAKQHEARNAQRRKEGKPEVPAPKQITYIDTMDRGLALVLVISYGGTRTFRVLTYVNGKPRSVKLGTYPEMSVKDARAKAREYFENPRQFAAQVAVGSFKEIAENWIKRHVEAHGLISAREIKRHLERYVYPKWKDRPFLEIRRHEVNELLDYIADHHGRSQADAVLVTIRSIMTWHQARDENYTSPIVPRMNRNKSKQARDRILNDNEIRQVWNAAGGCGTYGALAKTLLLTAQRKEKVTTLRWDDVADGEWTIRKQPREKGTGGKLKLPQMVLDVITAQPHLAGNPYVFAGRGSTVFSAFSRHKRVLEAKLGDLPHWTLHDLRRTARSLMSRAGVPRDIAERVLGHAIGGVEGVYDRHLYDNEKANALERLAHLIETIVNPPKDNVVRLPKRRQKS